MDAVKCEAALLAAETGSLTAAAVRGAGDRRSLGEGCFPGGKEADRMRRLHPGHGGRQHGRRRTAKFVRFRQFSAAVYLKSEKKCGSINKIICKTQAPSFGTCDGAALQIRRLIGNDRRKGCIT